MHGTGSLGGLVSLARRLARPARSLVWAGLAAAVALGLSGAAPAGAPSRVPVRATRVRVFVPETFTAQAYTTGSCWVGSIASDRADAYRCMTGNTIHDPCFAFGRGTAVECPTDPAAGRGVFIALTKPLPRGNPLPKPGAPVRPWWASLADGGRCGVMTGTDVFGRPFACGIPAGNGAVTPVYCTWPAPARGDPSLYTSRCAEGTVGAHGPRLGAERTYDIAAMWL